MGGPFATYFLIISIYFLFQALRYERIKDWYLSAIFAGIAAFLFYRLRKVLGKRTGFEKNQNEKINQTPPSEEKRTIKIPDLDENLSELSKAYEAIDNFDQKKTSVLQIGRDEYFKPEKVVSSKEYSSLLNKKFILSVSHLYPYKNIETLIHAFSKLRAIEIDLSLVLAGSTQNIKYLEKYEL